ncbi:hypothetical protein PTKU64_90660 (plasmid) [Paraburkholderia terrae]|uniref:Uncharacterized protein n=1 Tax=Paraburkholderia terrae TaxID=311230 RepID=A0ABM7U204_9BURK|nr:hypothetical protein [Paraburkholderia terrae]BCZ85391.1 hypothetical protein PTKU64_90660 [Paraburkholderia terrae]
MKILRYARYAVVALSASLIVGLPHAQLLKAIPEELDTPIPYGSKGSVQLQISVPRVDKTIALKSPLDIAWKQSSLAFGKITVLDTAGKQATYPIDFERNPFLTLTLELTPIASTPLTNIVTINYTVDGVAKILEIPIRIVGQCTSPNYANDGQQCDPQTWSCRVDRNSYPLLYVSRDSSDGISSEAIRTHDRKHRFAETTYDIPFLTFIDATGIGSFIQNRPACAINALNFTKVAKTTTVARFTWAQNAAAPLTALVGKTSANKITLEFPNKLTGYSSVNGNTAEYRFAHEIGEAPTMRIENNEGVLFDGKIECVLADGSLSVVRNADPDANKKDALPPKLHLIIEKK